MARKKEGMLEIERADAMKWCGLIKIHSAALSKSSKPLSDIEIENRLSKTRSSVEAEFSQATGLNFNRWRRGERAPSLNELQMLVARAREVGLLPPKRSLGTYESSQRERRARTHLPTPQRLSQADARAAWLMQVEALSALHVAARNYVSAKNALVAAATLANNEGADFFSVRSNEYPPGYPDDQKEDPFVSLQPKNVLEAVGYFLDGEAIDLWQGET